MIEIPSIILRLLCDQRGFPIVAAAGFVPVDMTGGLGCLSRLICCGFCPRLWSLRRFFRLVLWAGALRQPAIYLTGATKRGKAIPARKLQGRRGVSSTVPECGSSVDKPYPLCSECQNNPSSFRRVPLSSQRSCSLALFNISMRVSSGIWLENLAADAKIEAGKSEQKAPGVLARLEMEEST